MAEELNLIKSENKGEKYTSLIPQIIALTAGETNTIAALANIMAALKYGMNYFWVGCYQVLNKELVLGPFQGPIACTRIGFGKGVCGTVWKQKKTLIVDDVDSFLGHIACSSDTKSEIVLPVFDKEGDVRMILDIDSSKLADFDGTDEKHLQQIVKLMESLN